MKRIIFNKTLWMYFCCIIIIGAGGILANIYMSDAVCRAPSACVECHDIIGNTPDIIGNAAGSCERGDFILGPALTSNRFIHRPAKLNDGRVLLTGGAHFLGGVTDTADIYNPAANTMTPAAPMNSVRWSHTATTLNNGKVLVAGGRIKWGGPFPVLTSAELYDPSTDTWTLTGSMNVPRRSHTATLLPDGRVFIAGGGDATSTSAEMPIDSCEIYDPSTGTFSLVGNMTTPRLAHTNTLLDNGTVLITGGSNGLSTRYPTNLAEIYDPSDDSFTAVGPMNFSHLAQAATKMRDGRVLIAAGYYNPTHAAQGGGIITTECEIYDPVTQTFTPTASMFKQRIDIGGQLLLDGTVLIAGGVSTSAVHQTFFQPTTEIFNPDTEEWKLSGIMNDGRDEFSGVLLNDGRALITGGFNLSPGPTLLNTVEIYTPGMEEQVNGLRNVINDIPSSSLKGNKSRKTLLKLLDKTGKKLRHKEKEADDDDDEEDDDDNVGGGIPGGADGHHTVSNDGFYHRPEMFYAEEVCAACHGADLTGDLGPSCYSCHGAKWTKDDVKTKDLLKALQNANKLLEKVNEEITDEASKANTADIVQILINTLTLATTPNSLPTVTATATPSTGTEPLSVSFAATASDSDGTVDFYKWSFGDGKTSNAANPTHSYNCDGTYLATVKVWDNRGATAEATVQIDVASAGGGLSYACDVQLVFDKFCVGCHGSSAGLNLQNCNNLQAGSDFGPVIVPGNSAASTLYQEISTGAMPPGPTNVPAQDVANIAAWIDSLNPLDPNFCD